MRYFLTLAYCGTNYCGWQSQDNALSVQQVLETHLSTLLREDIRITGCGRTDTGVHASYYIAHLDSENLSTMNPQDFIFKINSFLPFDIVIYDIKNVISEAHARFDALKRTYEYHISGIKNPFKKNLSHFVSEKKYNLINVDIFNEACEIILKHDDFTSFSKSGTHTKTNICKIYQAHAVKDAQSFIFTITADRFLRNMVRALTGTMLDVAIGKLSMEDFRAIIESKNRSDAGESVPAEGLYLTNIEYPDTLFL